MQAQQQVFKVRRQYNRWVGNQTLEDYALRFTAINARQWSIDKVAKTALGATAFLALEAICAAVTINYGFFNTMLAMITIAAVIFVTGFPISYYAAKHGLDIDLLTRGAGFGYLGSTITSLIYASFTFIFFAIEAAILASAIKALFGIPLYIAYIICAVAVVPIVTHGISAISRFQVGTQNIWLVLQCAAIATALIFEFRYIGDWVHYQPKAANQPLSETPIGFDLALFGAAASIFFSMVAQIGEQVDYLRFMPEKTSENKKRWWFWLILAGPGWIFVGMIKMLLGSFLAYIAITKGISDERAADPVYMYQTVYFHLTQSPTFALILAAIMVAISQMKINVTNAYAGSIAWSNFFSRLTHSHPGRVVWLVFNVIIALILMELGIYRALESILGIFAIVAISWLGTLVADLMINKPLGFSPPFIEFKRAHLYDINPVGVGSMFIASCVGIFCYLGKLGDVPQYLSHFISLGLCFICAPLIAMLTKGKYYLARQSPELIQTSTTDLVSPSANTNIHCSICENHFEHEDMSYCPAYKGAICSLCCSLDARCMDSCKPEARLSRQIFHFFSLFVPVRFAAIFDSRIGRLGGILLSVNLATGAILTLIYYHMQPSTTAEIILLQSTMWTLFFTLLIISGVISWLFLLSHESRVIAQQESNRQTSRLILEIEAHEKTDMELQKAKEYAEQANNAKSRYLSGISHELRTPLQSILGYTQLLGQQQDIPERHLTPLKIIKRSGEYLTDLIEGLLDISKIEAGRIEIYRNNVNLHDFLDQLVLMFNHQAKNKGIQFRYRNHQKLPHYVTTDEKRLRQILINLLSNAIKYTERGRVDFDVYYRNQVAEFSISDTGIGIHKKDLERIMTPFERVRRRGSENVAGTGLGLTIAKLLAEIMGGDLRVESSLGSGSCFTASIMLSPSTKATPEYTQAQHIIGYQGHKKYIAIVDDEPTHRQLLSDLLNPLGFKTILFPDAVECLSYFKTNTQGQTNVTPDLFILDVMMPELNGFELAEHLRQEGVQSPILMVSANAEEHHRCMDQGCAHNDYLVKPVNQERLLDKVAQLLEIKWHTSAPQESSLSHEQQHQRAKLEAMPGTLDLPQHDLLMELLAYAQIGYKKGATETLEKLEKMGILDPPVLSLFNDLVGSLCFDRLSKYLEAPTQ